jgi:uncharacterized protein YbaP (TraB family)
MSHLLTTLAALALATALLAAPQAHAECQGLNLLDLMPASERATLTAAADAVPFPRGKFWRAEKDNMQITLIGTYHLNDPRHAAATERFRPEIEAARTLLVEAGPEEEKALLQHMGRDPSVLTITEGPTLMEQLPPETWEKLAAAASARGIPPFMTNKFRPWYITVLLAVPPCAMVEMATPNGLDQQLIDTAVAAGVEVRALERYDTIFTIFGVLSNEDQLAMIEQTLAMEDQISDFSETLADAYFDGESRLIWELMRHLSYSAPGYTREEVDAEMAVLEEAMMNSRNRAWIPVIEIVAARGPTVVAFGALHLPGEEGVLNLLHQSGWTISPLDPPPLDPQ